MSTDGPMTGWKDYEQFVTELVGDLAQELHGQGCRVERGRRIPGASGFAHEIDASVQSADHLYIAECKYWNASVPVGVVLTFLGRMVDIMASPEFAGLKVVAAVFTTKGYQSGCEKIGDRYRIELEVVRDRSDFVVRYLSRVRAALQDTIVLSDGVREEVKPWPSDG